jgi:hypothetical protein
MELEIIMLSEISQTEKDKCSLSYAESSPKNDKNIKWEILFGVGASRSGEGERRG